MSNYSDSSSVMSPAIGAFAVTPSDTVNFTIPARAIYVGEEGDVTLVTKQGEVVTFVGVVAGTILPVVCLRVNSTNTDAASIVGLY